MISEDIGHLCLKEIIPIFKIYTRMVIKLLSNMITVREIVPETIKSFELIRIRMTLIMLHSRAVLKVNNLI